jgi:hypothetical protein
MTLPDRFPRRFSRPAPAVAAMPTEGGPGPADVNPADVSWPWRRAALLLCIAAQLITISALESADPLAVSWASVLLATAPAALAAVAAFAPVRVARPAAALAVIVLVAGIAAQATHTGVFFVPALVVMAVAAVRLRGER